MSKAILLMAHGAPANLDEVEEYVLHIRHGRPLPAVQMQTIKDRYKLVGGSPLIHWTQAQAEKLQQRVAGKVYIGMRHSHPFINETVQQMAADNVEEFIALCLAPQFSKLTIGAYQTALDEAIAATGMPSQYTIVNSYARHPKLIHAFQTKLEESRAQHPDAFVIFTAHSLPERVLQEGDPYDFEVKETARLVANASKLPDWRFAYQSQGMTSEKWLGPTVESRIEQLAEASVKQIIIDPIGFVCDHVEILYDIDVAFREYAAEKDIVLHRAASLNDSPEFIDLLSTLIQERS
jgi:protoporphyrin/coproporphyrin ferrochelatase